MKMIKINGINLNVDIKGNGHPLILIHGLGGDISQWDYEIDRLSQKFQTIALDCRGHGQSDKPEFYTIQDHILDILGLMDFYKIEKASLYGISMGSYIGQGVAISASERIDKLILVSSTSNGLTSSVQRIISDNPKDFKGLKNQNEMVLALLKYMAYNPEKLKKSIHLLDTKMKPEHFLRAIKALAGFDFRKDLPTIKAKTLVISGKYDSLNPPSEGRLCASLIPNATFIEMQYSGHIPVLEEPETYNKIIDDFLIN
ncbi:MAG: alpha/beta hydrolase [Bacteroidales bacterium]|nr:alpha/beta hydrolase [Bacteroidales bacterium]